MHDKKFHIFCLDSEFKRNWDASMKCMHFPLSTLLVKSYAVWMEGNKKLKLKIKVSSN